MSVVLDRSRLAVRIGWGLLFLRQSDVLLSSFPRSGNTWIRSMLWGLVRDVEPAAAARLMAPRRAHGKAFLELDSAMPELGVISLRPRWPVAVIPRIVKTHLRCNARLRGRRSIGVVRDPRDTMVSYYHYERYRLDRYSGSFSSFIRDPARGLKGWRAHYLSWRREWDLVVRYETLKAEPCGELSRILRYLGAHVDDDTVSQVVRATTKEKTARDDSWTRRTGHGAFARDSNVGQWSQHAVAADERYCTGILTDLFDRETA